MSSFDRKQSGDMQMVIGLLSFDPPPDDGGKNPSSGGYGGELLVIK